jgi:WD40 repeat protein
MRAAAVLLLAAATATAGELPPITESFRQSVTLHLDAVLGDYPWRHGAEVTTVGFAPDGKTFATVGGDRKIKLWRADGAELRSFGPARGRTYAAVFSADAQTLVVTSSNGTAVLWNTATGTVRTALNHGAAVTFAVFLPDGKRLATAARDRSVKVWDLASATLLATASFAPDADAGTAGPAIAALGVDRHSDLLVALADGSIVSVDAATGTTGRRIEHPLDTDAAAFSADGRRLVACAYGDLRVVDVATGQDRLLGPDVGLPAGVALSANGRRVAFASREGKLTVYDTDGSLSFTVQAHTAEIVDVGISPDGALAITASRDYSFRVWDVASGKPLAHRTSRAQYALAFAGEGRLAAAGADGELRIWDPAAGTQVTLGKHAGAIYGLAALGADIVVSGGDDGTLRFWDADDTKSMAVKAHTGGVLAVAASADGKRLISAGADEKVRLWDPRRHRRLGSFDMSGPVAAVALARDGKRGVAGDDHGAVRLFAVPAMTLAARLRGTDGLVQAAAFSPDGKTILAGSEDDTVRRYRGRDHASQTLVGHHAPVTAVVFAGERYGISAAKDGTVVVWDLASGLPIDRIDLHASDDQPLALAVAPDEKTVAVGTARGVILLYSFADPAP